MVEVQLWQLLVTMGVPTAVTGFLVWRIQRKIDMRDKAAAEERRKQQEKLDEKERARERFELHIIKSVGASIALGEATARAVQRIPDAKCNGDMHAALEYAEKVKHEQKDFVNEQFVKNII